MQAAVSPKSTSRVHSIRSVATIAIGLFEAVTYLIGAIPVRLVLSARLSAQYLDNRYDHKYRWVASERDGFVSETQRRATMPASLFEVAPTATTHVQAVQ
jgi:hypothetical protein